MIGTIRARWAAGVCIWGVAVLSAMGAPFSPSEPTAPPSGRATVNIQEEEAAASSVFVLPSPEVMKALRDEELARIEKIKQVGRQLALLSRRTGMSGNRNVLGGGLWVLSGTGVGSSPPDLKPFPVAGPEKGRVLSWHIDSTHLEDAGACRLVFHLQRPASSEVAFFGAGSLEGRKIGGRGSTDMTLWFYCGGRSGAGVVHTWGQHITSFWGPAKL